MKQYTVQFGKLTGKATKVWGFSRKSEALELCNKLSYVLWEEHKFKNSELVDELTFEDDEFFISVVKEEIA